MKGVTVRELLAWARGLLASHLAGSLEAEILLGHVLGVSRAWLYANGDQTVDGGKQETFRNLAERRQQGEPIAYLTGVREFWSLPLQVTPDVLIPRPETEILVEAALDLIPTDAAWRVADLGTGSGAVALAIASERPLCEVHATELSPAALAVAQGNGDALLPGRVQFHLGSWLEPLQGCFQLIVSNPPYVAADDEHLRQGDCRFEPIGALTTGEATLAAIDQIAQQSRSFLGPGGWLAMEHGWDQGRQVRTLLERYGYCGVETRKDLEGRERITRGMKKS